MKNEKMNTFDTHEKKVQKYYDTYWSLKVQHHTFNENQAIHHGFFEKDTKTHREAMQNMDKVVENLLSLHEMDKKDYLDIGCGIGGTSIYLAKKYSKSNFSGITISPVEVTLANKIINKQKILNTKFILGNFLNMEFPDGCFDGVFALESINHSPDKRHLIREISQILKPGGKLVVIDWFRTETEMGSFMRKIYDTWRIGQADIKLESFINFALYLKEEGFSEVQVKKLTANIKRSLLNTFFIWSPVFGLTILKKFMIGRKEKSFKEMKDLLSSSSLDIFIGFGNIAEYLTVTAVKR